MNVTKSWRGKIKGRDQFLLLHKRNRLNRAGKNSMCECGLRLSEFLAQPGSLFLRL